MLGALLGPYCSSASQGTLERKILPQGCPAYVRAFVDVLEGTGARLGSLQHPGGSDRSNWHTLVLGNRVHLHKCSQQALGPQVAESEVSATGRHPFLPAIRSEGLWDRRPPEWEWLADSPLAREAGCWTQSVFAASPRRHPRDTACSCATQTRALPISPATACWGQGVSGILALPAPGEKNQTVLGATGRGL